MAGPRGFDARWGKRCNRGGGRPIGVGDGVTQSLLDEEGVVDFLSLFFEPESDFFSVLVDDVELDSEGFESEDFDSDEEVVLDSDELSLELEETRLSVL
jgi:hypothetical protein